MGFLFPHAPKPPTPPNPAMAAPTNNPFADPLRSSSSFISGATAGRKPGLAKTSLIGGG
jgi:hypothetical protein